MNTASTSDNGGRILVVDDDPDIARFVEINMRLEGFDVRIARDGEEALAAVSEAMPDLVLLDVMMPRIDGVEVCRRLRADPATAHLPVIMLTAKSLSADKVVGLTAGADDYLIKPFDTLALIARVRSPHQAVRHVGAHRPGPLDAAAQRRDARRLPIDHPAGQPPHRRRDSAP